MADSGEGVVFARCARTSGKTNLTVSAAGVSRPGNGGSRQVPHNNTIWMAFVGGEGRGLILVTRHAWIMAEILWRDESQGSSSQLHYFAPLVNHWYE